MHNIIVHALKLSCDSSCIILSWGAFDAAEVLSRGLALRFFNRGLFCIAISTSAVSTVHSKFVALCYQQLQKYLGSSAQELDSITPEFMAKTIRKW